MLTSEQIKKNSEQLIELVKSIRRNGADVGGLVDFLKESDFFIAPASTQYQCSYEGGLCEHTLNVYNILKDLSSVYIEDFFGKMIDETSIILLALGHDLSRINYYEEYGQNKKVYSSSGSKQDALGRFDWETIKGYKVKDASERNTLGNEGFNSYYILSKFIPLTEEESVAIINHKGTVDDASKDVLTIFSKYPLATLLHISDLMACFVIDSRD